MEAGKLRHKIEIQSPLETRDTNGEVSTVWIATGIVWASVEPLSGRELWLAQQIQSEVSVRIRLRYLRGITTGHRVNFGGRLFDIKAAINAAERNEELELLCTERG